MKINCSKLFNLIVAVVAMEVSRYRVDSEIMAFLSFVVALAVCEQFDKIFIINDKKDKENPPDDSAGATETAPRNPLYPTPAKR